MEITYYLFIGLLISGLLAVRANLSTLLLACAYWLITLLWTTDAIQPFYFNQFDWVQLLDVHFSYYIDGLARLFVLLIAGIGLLVLIYAWFYAEASGCHKGKLLSLLQLFAISMLGMIVANDLIMLFLCWELTSIVSYLLIQFDVTDKEANQAAFNSLFVSSLGGLILLVGFILLHQAAGSWDIQAITLQLSTTHNNTLRIAFFLMLAGVITKSAQFPFYFWLTGAMKAPTPVSAYLHSATMVNAGIYLLARFHPLFSGLDEWYPVLSVIGLLTMLLSSLLSYVQSDLKAILAYTTIFALGIMVYLLGGKTALTLQAFAAFFLFHAIYKAGAFMLVGVIEKQYHSRELYSLRGIARRSFWLCVATVIIFGAMAGIPPFFGFTVKEMIYEAKLASGSVSYILMTVSTISSMLIAATSFRCLWVFFQPNQTTAPIQDANQTNQLLMITPMILVGLIILLSVFDRTVQYLVEPVVMAINQLPELPYTKGNDFLSFLLSFSTFSGGILIYMILGTLKQSYLRYAKPFELKNAFEYVFARTLLVGKKLTELTQGTTYSTQMKIFIAAFIVLIGGLFALGEHPMMLSIQTSPTLSSTIVCGFLLLSSLSLLYSVNFLYNLISLSLVGLSTSAFFIIHGAVDVAITQLLVEVLTIIILLIALRSTKIAATDIPRYDRLINATISIAGGALICTLLVLLQTIPFNAVLQTFFVENSLKKAYGKNVVNVILVDFRSLDTFGEVIVIIATSIGATLLIKQYASRKRKKHVNHH